MKLIRPQSVTDAKLTSSNVPEADAPVWNAATAYTVGQRVIRTTGVHKIFERKVAGTTTTPPESDTVNWFEVGATNRWAMFDYVVGSQTVNAGSIVVSLTMADVANAIALLNIDAETLRIKYTNPTTGVIYDQTISLLDSSAITDWYYYFFEPISYRKDIVFTALPTDAFATIEITLSKASGNVAIGVLAIGQSQEVGTTQSGAGVGIKDYSRKETDTFGNYIIVPRAFSKSASFTVAVERNRVDQVHRLLTELRTTPVVFIGAEVFDSTVIYGFYRDFDITINYPMAELKIEIEGLT